MAETLADAPKEALAKASPDTLKQIANALVRAPQTAAQSSDGSASNADTPTSGTVVSQANGVEVRALPPPPPPSALSAPGSSSGVPEPGAVVSQASAIEVRALSAPPPSTALPGSGSPPIASKPDAAPESDQADISSQPLRLILKAPAAALAEIPVLLLARALTEIDTSKLTADSQAGLPAALATARAELKLDLDAREFVTELTRPTLRPIAAATADHFMRADQKLDLGLKALPQLKSIDELLADGVDENRTVTRVRITHRLEPIKPAELLVRATRSPGEPIRILKREQITEIPLAEALRMYQLKPTVPLIAVREVRVLEPTTIAELKREAKLKPGELQRVIAGAPNATQRTVEELLGLKRTKAGTVYYVRTVQRKDVQGIWGIIQAGLIDNFARGMAIARGDQVSTYQVHIPRLADEPLADNRGSSFLGRMIFQKMRRSTIYNIKLGRIATKPENIMPGQQIVIVDFSPQELIAIYRHFARTLSTS